MAALIDIQDHVLRLTEPWLPEGDDAAGRTILREINRAQRRAQELHSFRAQRAVVTFTTVATTRQLGVKPADWKESRAKPLLIENDGGIIQAEWASNEEQALKFFGESATADTGEPKLILEHDTAFDVYPFSDGASDWAGGQYRVRLYYYKWLADLAAAADTNWLTANAEEYLIFAAAGALLSLVPGQEARAEALRLGPLPLRRPQTKTDFELFRAVQLDARSRIPQDIALSPRGDVRS